MYLKEPKTLHAAATGTGNGVELHDLDYKLNDLRRTEVVLEITGTSTTFSVQPEVSLNGSTWYSLGSALTAKGLHELTVKTPYFRARIASLDANLTIKAA